jgi:vacuolar protein sorting-associated protein 13A/C
MFETIVATVLNKVLGSYIADLEQNQLKLGIFNGIFEGPVVGQEGSQPDFIGNVVLKNLKLKTEALDKLNLPVEILHGTSKV